MTKIKKLQRLEHWNSGGFGSRWKEATSMKQSRGHQGNETKELAEGKMLCLQGQKG